MLAIRVRFIRSTDTKPCRICADNGKNKMYVAYDYISFEEQSLELVEAFVKKYHFRARGFNRVPVTYKEVDYYGLL